MTQVPEQDKPENQDPSVGYALDRYGRKVSLKDGKPLPEDQQGRHAGYGSGAVADLSAQGSAPGQAEEDRKGTGPVSLQQAAAEQREAARQPRKAQGRKPE